MNQNILIALALLLLTFSSIQSANALEHKIADKTNGQVSPYILDAETYSLNVRNVKTLKAYGRYLWIGTAKGAIRYDLSSGDDYKLFDNKNGLLSNGVFAIAIDKSQTPWIGTYGGGLSRFDGKTWDNINTPHGLADAFIFDIQFANEGVWVATWSGANYFTKNPLTGGKIKTYTVENTNKGLIDNWVYAIQIGKNGKVWFGTESGVSLFDNGSWRYWTHENGLGAPFKVVEKENVEATASFQGSHHSLYPAHDNASPNYRPNYVLSMLLDSNDNLWVGTWGGGLSLLNVEKNTFRNFTQKDGLPGNFILTLKEGPEGKLWIGTNKGLSRFDGKTFQNYSTLNGLISDFIFSVEFTQDHSVWLGGYYGVNQLSMEPGTGKLAVID